MLSEYMKRRQTEKIFGKVKEEKPKTELKKVSDKKKKELAGEDKSDLDQWFEERRAELVGVCQCGCGQKSCKDDDLYFKHSICHIFPKRIFKSVAMHPLNFIERAFWGGCHSVLDDTSMDKWPNMADWEDIVAKFNAIIPFIPESEKSTKFYSQLEALVNGSVVDN